MKIHITRENGICRRIATAAAIVCLVSSAPVRAQMGEPAPKRSAASQEAAAPEASPEAEPSAVPRATAVPSRCQEYIDVLSGKKKDEALLSDPNLKAVAARPQGIDLLFCLAVAADSDAPCALTPEDAPQHGDECRMTRAVFHELRTNPGGSGFMFPDFKYKACRAEPKLAPICDRWRAAARSGNPNDCTGLGDMETECRAEITLDASLCAKTEEPEGCKKAIEAARGYAKGLKSVAGSGSARDQALAKAALGEADACAPFAQAALASCAGGEAPSLRRPAAGEAAPPAASPKAPAPRKSPAPQ